MSAEASRRLSDRIGRGNVFEPRCPSRAILKHVTSSWGLLALIALKGGTLRFSQLRRAVNGVSERMLAQTLQQLEADGLVIRHSHEVVPPHVDYRLSDLGRQAADHVEALADWIENNLPALLHGRETTPVADD